jgi:lysophospholipase L1-like esterase
MINLKKLTTNILFITVSFVITLLFIEIFYQSFFADNIHNKRFLFITKPSLLDQNKSFGYNKNTFVREMAVYGNGNNFHIEYDTSFVTNNIGLVQKKGFDPKKQSIVIIGDSFTQGQGATPWFYQLEDDWKNNEYQLINLGIIGTGIVQWKDTLQWFSSIGKIKQIIICCISNDWIRPRWYICENAEQNVLAFDILVKNKLRKNHKKPIIYFIDKDSDHYTILKRAKHIAESSDGGINEFLKNLFLASITHRILLNYNLLSHDNNKSNNDEVTFSKNKTSFDQIISAYGAKNITVLHLPQKKEVIQGAYSELGTKIKNFILSRHIPYIDGLALCKLNKKDFYRDDGHPNASGYKKIYDCFSKNVLANLRLE